MTGAFALLDTAVHAAAADAYPQRAVRLIVPYPAGGAGDIVGRLLSARLGETLGQQIVIDNRGGGAQLIATEIAAKAPADGYTLFLASATHSINPGPQKKLRTIRSAILLRSDGREFAARVRRQSIDGRRQHSRVVAAAKAQPGKINYASSGPGTGGHLAVELLSWMAGIKFTHVPYKGAAPALVDVIGGQVNSCARARCRRCLTSSPASCGRWR